MACPIFIVGSVSAASSGVIPRYLAAMVVCFSVVAVFSPSSSRNTNHEDMWGSTSRKSEGFCDARDRATLYVLASLRSESMNDFPVAVCATCQNSSMYIDTGNGFGFLKQAECILPSSRDSMVSPILSLAVYSCSGFALLGRSSPIRLIRVIPHSSIFDRELIASFLVFFWNSSAAYLVSLVPFSSTYSSYSLLSLLAVFLKYSVYPISEQFLFSFRYSVRVVCMVVR